MQTTQYVTANQLCQRFGGRSYMWLWRLLKDEAANFPKPIVIRRHRYWREAELAAWEASRSEGGADASAA